MDNGKENGSYHRLYVRRTPHPVIVSIRDTSNYIRVLLYSYYTSITGWGVHLSYMGDYLAKYHRGY